MRLADEFLQQIPNQLVTLFDKGFWSADLMLRLSGQGTNRHWLTPARKNLVSEEVVRYGKNVTVWPTHLSAHRPAQTRAGGKQSLARRYTH